MLCKRGVVMTIEELLSGESKNTEFKRELPENSKKYMKSVVAFANGVGGKIIIGVEDGSREVVGVDKDSVFDLMDALANAISDSCEPLITPDITMQTVDGKTIIIVEVSVGKQRPYYIKSEGKEKGVYVRVAGTTRPADEAMIRELFFEGSKRCFDQTVCLNKKVTDDEIQSLCHSLKDVAVRNSGSESERAEIKDVTVQQLLSWGIVVEQNGEYLPTNAYAILTGDWPTTIQCGVFKGTTKAVFVDRRSFDGALWEQIEQAYQFVLRNIHLGANIQGLYRQDEYEIPTDAIRELIINAVVHRSYLDSGNIQVAIYDDRLEVTSPGKLPMGQTVARMKEGYSKVRNEALAKAFSYMKLIEQWGSGVPRIIEKVKAAGLREPEFIGGDTDLRVNIYRGRVDGNRSENTAQMSDKMSDKSNLSDKMSDKEKAFYGTVQNLLAQSESITTREIINATNMKDSTARRYLSKLCDWGLIRAEGKNKGARYYKN